jgi:hypothetical protein
LAGTIIADYIRTDANQLSLNVGNTTFATINAMGFLSNTGVQIISPTGTVNGASIAANTIVANSLASTLDLSSKTVTLPTTTVGMELVGRSAWTTSTSSVSFTHDPTKYEQYLLYYWVTHDPSWGTTVFRFRNSGGDITSSHYASTANFQPTTENASYNTNSSPYGGTSKTFIWLAGNGAVFDAHGSVLVSIPNTGINYPSIRGTSTLIFRTSDTTYQEESGGTYYNAYGNTITGFTLLGTGGGSSRGLVTVYGIRK